MKRAVLAVLFLSLVGALAVVPASADTTLYDNTGLTSNVYGGFTINFGSKVSDSFTLSQSSTVTSANFLIWLNPGDTLSNVDWSIGTSAFDTSIGAATAATSSLGQTTSGGGVYNIFDESISIPSLSLGAGTYWFTLQNAVVSNNGDQAFWDISNGPSSAVWGSAGPVPSETFQILGTEDSNVTPEPSSFLLLGSGLAGLAGLIKRKLAA